MRTMKDSNISKAAADGFVWGLFYGLGVAAIGTVISAATKVVKAAKEGMAERKAAKDVFKSQNPAS